MWYAPPCRTSISAKVTEFDSPGPNHWLSACGSVQARQTFSGATG
jgi:hypothetical protein